MKKRLSLGIVTGIVTVACSCMASTAFAQQPKGGNKGGGGGVLNVGEITIVGRVQKPIASVDVSKIPAKLTLAELRQPFLDRIEEAVIHEPF